MKLRKLPKIGDHVAYTRNFIASVPDRADWRGVIVAACDYATAAWPMVRVRWRDGYENDINLHNLCTIKSVAFVEGNQTRGSIK